MMEILFKGKDKDDGNWYEGYYLRLHDTTYCSMPSDNVEEANRLNKENKHHYIVFEQMTDWGLPNKHLRAEVLPETVCQYTGLPDKEGRKIFKWDIVDQDGTIGIVKFGKYENGFHYGFYIEWPKCPLLRQELSFWNGKSRVIGNIFDNPDLIKERREDTYGEME